MIAVILAAGATEVELEGQLAGLSNADPAFHNYVSGRFYGGLGLQAAIRPEGLPVAVVGTWQHHAAGSTVSSDLGSFRAAFDSHVLTLGPRFGIEFVETFTPYVTVQGAMWLNRSRFDEQPSVSDNLGQVAYRGVQPGVLSMAGVEFSTPTADRTPLEFICHIEMGYAWSAPGELGGLGPSQTRGFLARTGVGARFGRR